jgi:hypothetical protein
VFLRYFSELDQPATRVVDVILGRPPGWLTTHADESITAGLRIAGTLGLPLVMTRSLASESLQFGEPVWLPGATVIPIRWSGGAEDAGSRSRTEVELEVAAVGPSNSQLAINVRYEIPIDFAERRPDQALLHRVAEGAVRDFLDRLIADVRLSLIAVQTQ